MADYTVTLNNDQIEAWQDMLGIDDITQGLEDHLAGVAKSHISGRVAEELDSMTDAEKISILPSFKIKEVKPIE